jgi:Family of unknown function (DUF6339)
MRKRWAIDAFLDYDQKAKRFVLSRYFIAQNQSRAILRNGAARLWWSAQLTHDAQRKNPYELTAVLLSRLDIAQQLLERNLGRIKTLRLTFLDFLLNNKSECLDSGQQSRSLVRHLAQSLNMHGGVCLLDCMNSEAIRTFLESEMSAFCAGPRKLDHLLR